MNSDGYHLAKKSAIRRSGTATTVPLYRRSRRDDSAHNRRVPGDLKLQAAAFADASRLDNLESTFRARNECASGQTPAVLKLVNREFHIPLKINGVCYSLARWRSFLLFVVSVTFVGFSPALATLTAPKCSRSSRRCSKVAANSQNTIELKIGGVGERLKPAVLKTVRPERVSGVRIPPPPPDFQTLKNRANGTASLFFQAASLSSLCGVDGCSTIIEAVVQSDRAEDRLAATDSCVSRRLASKESCTSSLALRLSHFGK